MCVHVCIGVCVYTYHVHPYILHNGILFNLQKGDSDIFDIFMNLGDIMLSEINRKEKQKLFDFTEM